MAQAMPAHDRSRKPEEEEEEDPVIKMISKTGCLELHYAVQECMSDNQDWRKCQQQVDDFRKCMSQANKSREKN